MNDKTCNHATKGIFNLPLLLIVFCLSLSTNAESRNYLIYSISQDLPMGEEQEVVKKNFYLNIGQKQGVKPGTELNVYRLFSRDNSFASEKKSFYKVAVGKVQVVHAEEENSIAIAQIDPDEKNPIYFEVNSIMIGDHVDTQ